jgi:hypothetical protein
MAALKSITKAQIERKNYTLDYSCWLGTNETLYDFVIVISPATVPPLVANGAYASVDLLKLTTFLQGGLANTNYLISFIATTSIGQVKRDDLQMRVT